MRHHTNLRGIQVYFNKRNANFFPRLYPYSICLVSPRVRRCTFPVISPAGDSLRVVIAMTETNGEKTRSEGKKKTRTISGSTRVRDLRSDCARRTKKSRPAYSRCFVENAGVNVRQFIANARGARSGFALIYGASPRICAEIYVLIRRSKLTARDEMASNRVGFFFFSTSTLITGYTATAEHGSLILPTRFTPHSLEIKRRQNRQQFNKIVLPVCPLLFRYASGLSLNFVKHTSREYGKFSYPR